MILAPGERESRCSENHCSSSAAKTDRVCEQSHGLDERECKSSSFRAEEFAIGGLRGTSAELREGLRRYARRSVSLVTRKLASPSVCDVRSRPCAPSDLSISDPHDRLHEAIDIVDGRAWVDVIMVR